MAYCNLRSIYIHWQATVVEVRDANQNIGLILSHEYQSNIQSDAVFGEAFVANDPLTDEINSLSADGAYYRKETVEKELEKNRVQFI